MFDFRYHALSLMAVFIALAVGLLLGVAIGDQELVSSAKNDLRNSLRADVRKADDERDGARADLAREQSFIDAAYPILTGGRLQSQKVGIVLLGANPRSAVDDIRKALQPTGADVELVAVVDRTLDRTDLAKRAMGTRYVAVATDDKLLEPFGQRIGVQLVTGGQLASRERSALISSQSGDFGGLDKIVVVRAGATPKDKAAADALGHLQDGIVDGLSDSARTVVGAERYDADRSQIGWYRDRGLSTVDNVDERAGHAALVYVLAGAQGAYGRKDSADAVLPSVVRPARRG